MADNRLLGRKHAAPARYRRTLANQPSRNRRRDVAQTSPRHLRDAREHVAGPAIPPSAQPFLIRSRREAAHLPSWQLKLAFLSHGRLRSTGHRYGDKPPEQAAISTDDRRAPSPLRGNLYARHRTARSARPTGAEMSSDSGLHIDRKSTRLNFSHPSISYAVFCLKKKK